ncbi:MAG: hypothetical protein AAF078_14040, partial [Planctomycetota bacterium]
SVRVPLIVRPPRSLRDAWGYAGQGRSISENVSLADLFATICDFTGTPLPSDEETPFGAGLDSRSLVPLLRGDVSAGHGWDNEAVSQFGGTDLMIKRDALKYTFYEREGVGETLFDLAGDPVEHRNAIDDPAYAASVERFRARRDALGFGAAGSPGYRNAGYAAGVGVAG